MISPLRPIQQVHVPLKQKMLNHLHPPLTVARTTIHLGVLLALLWAGDAAAQPYEISEAVVSGGGGESSGGTYTVTGTIGESAVGHLSGGTYELDSGFWNVVQAIQTPGAPRLLVRQLGTNIIVSWPTSEIGWFLEVSSQVGDRATWTRVPGTPLISEQRYSVNLVVKPGLMVFRLRKA